MKSYTGKLRLALVLLAVLMAGTLWFGIAKGYADPGGRAWSCGYFDNRCFVPGTGGWLYTPVFPSGITAGLSTTSNGGVESKAKFIAFMNSMLGGSTQERTGAAFLIDLILPGNSRDRTPGITNFANAINQANVTLRFNSNQSYLGWNSGSQVLWNQFSGAFTTFDNDDAFFPDTGSAPALDIYQNGTLVFVIKQVCANPLGNMAGLTVTPSWDLTLTSSVDTPVAQPGDVVTWTHKIHNAGPDTADFDRTIQHAYPPAGYVNEATIADSLAAGNTRTLVQGITIPATATAGQLFCQRITVNHATNPTSGGRTSAQACVKVIVLTCGAAAISPNPLQPGDAINSIKVSINYAGGLPAYTAMKLQIPAPFNGGGYTASIPATSLAKTATTLSATFTGLPNAPAGGPANYPMIWDLMDSGTVVFGDCNGGLRSVNLPYFSVYGADVSSGGDFEGTTCTNTAGNGTISSWYDSQTAYAGANVLLSAIALGQITGFASGQYVPTTPNPTPSELAFANAGGGVSITSSASLPKLGGTFAGSGAGGTSCFFTPKPPAGTPTSGSPGSLTVGGMASGAYSYNGNLTLNGGSGLPAGHNVAIFVKGNVYINSNITYANPNGAGNWSVAIGSSNVPSFTLSVTGGNIYVNSGVTELDGMYVSQAASGNGGTIYTCGTAYAPTAAVNLSGCNNQLVVYGTFTADQVNLMRTFGTLLNADNNEYPTGGSKVCSSGPNKPVCAGELFEFSPEIYLSDPATAQPNNGPPTYNAITSLPPVL